MTYFYRTYSYLSRGNCKDFWISLDKLSRINARGKALKKRCTRFFWFLIFSLTFFLDFFYFYLDFFNKVYVIFFSALPLVIYYQLQNLIIEDKRIFLILKVIEYKWEISRESLMGNLYFTLLQSYLLYICERCACFVYLSKP